MAYLGKTISYLLHLNASEETFNNSRRLRKNMTDAEKLLWAELRNRKVMGLKFRRQHPISFYIADFYCHEQRLVIELDGEIHRQQKQIGHDENRTAELKRLGIRVIRFTNEQVFNSMNGVLEIIKENVDV